MEYKRESGKIIVRLDRGDEVVSSLLKIIKDENLKGGFISAIGAADIVEVGLYEVEKQRYQSKRFEGDFEIISCLGNVSRKDGEPYLHLHMSFGDKDFNVHGGHLSYCRISGTFECVIGLTESEINRMKDSKTGLNVFKI